MDKPLTTSTLKVAQHCIKQAIKLNASPTSGSQPSEIARAINRLLEEALNDVVQAIEKR